MTQQNRLDEYIAKLTQADRKTLTQKALKLSEEAGELAKAVLPFEGAYATNHRMVNPEKILEECADVMLVAQSIAHDLGFSADALHDMMFRKAQIWDGLQRRENRALENGEDFPFEIHITISGEDGIDLERFRLHCQNIGVKPIVLELLGKEGGLVMDDMMTSSKFYGDNGEAVKEAYRIADRLTQCGYKVIRKKIESAWWHPMAPHIADGNTEMPKGCYFEAHVGVESDEEKNILLANLARKNKAHLSRNVFKKTESAQIMMVTYRSWDPYESFNTGLENLLKDLKSHDFKYEKVIVEFSVYDDKQNHDAKWLDKEVHD